MTATELAARLTGREFLEWQWFDALEGLPDRRADWRAGTIAAVIANVNRKKGTKPYTPRDFMPHDRVEKATPSGAPQRVSGFFEYLAARAGTPRE